MSKQEKILKHLKDFGSITSIEAFEQYKVTRLSAVIFELRKVHKIMDVWESYTNSDNEKSHYKRFLYYGLLNEQA